MKNIIYAIIAISFAACTNKEERLSPDQHHEILVTPSGDEQELFPTMVVNEPDYKKRTNKDYPVAESSKIAGIEREIEGIAPFPVLSGSIKKTDQMKALRSYRKMSDHFNTDQFKSNPMVLSTFRTSYSKKLLFDYDLINSERYDNIGFLTNELIDCKMGNYPTIIASLKKLRNNIDVKSFDDMLNRTKTQIQQSFEREKANRSMIEKLVRDIEADSNTPFTSDADKNSLTRVRMTRFHLAVLKNSLKVDRIQLLRNYSKEINAM